MSGFFTFLWLVANIVMIVFIANAIRSKNAEEKRKNRKIWLIALGVAFLCLIIAAIIMPPIEDNTIEITAEDTATETEVKEDNVTENTENVDVVDDTFENKIEELKAELKEKYDITEPSEFAKGDTTGKWRINTVANATSPNDYAVDYARAYMSDGDVYYIVNLSLKTTNRFRLNNNILEVYTTEYVDKEELDASEIGSGMEYSDKYYDMTTGEEFTSEADESAGSVTSDELITVVEEAIDGAVGEGEKITDVTFDGTTLTVKVDMSGADTSLFSAAEIAEDRISSITDNILELDDKYYNTWEKVTVDFGNIGSITLDKSDVVNNGFGKYFDYPYGVFTE